MALAIRLDDVLAGLSAALDLVEGEPLGHAGRSALIALRLADRLELEGTDRDVLLYATLLKDAGCSSNAARITALFGADDRWVKADRARISRSEALALTRYLMRHTRPHDPPLRRARGGARILRDFRREAKVVADLRCRTGAEVVAALGLPEPRPIATVLRTLEERWDGRGLPDGLAGLEIPLPARIVQVAQTAEVWVGTGGVRRARRELRERAGRLLDPELVDLFEPLLEDASLWRSLEGPAWKAALRAQTDDARMLELDSPGIERVALVFAGIVDRKSPYTARHSERVAELADALAARLGVGGKDDDGDRRTLRCAALLHDIGKLGVPNTILDAPRRLSGAEVAQLRGHAELTRQILWEIRPLREAARIASGHHERLDGSGYPQGLRGAELTLGIRIIAVADTFEALTALRPYRKPLSPAGALERLRGETPARYDPAVVDELGALVAGEAPATRPPAVAAGGPR